MLRFSKYERKFLEKIFILLFFAFFFPLSAFAKPLHLTILHFNDFHGRFTPAAGEKDPKGGAARLASLIQQIEKENEKKGFVTILLYAGDANTGSLISSEFQGKAEVEFFNLVGMDAMALGNHEFDLPITTLQKRLKEASFAVVSANIEWEKNQETFVPPTTILGVSGTKIGILGLTTADTPSLVNPQNVKDLEFYPTLSSAKRVMKDLEKTSDIQIALTHQGVEEDVALARKLRGLEAVVGGHDHIKADTPCVMVRRIPVCQVPAFARYLGRMDFEVEGKSAKLLSTELLPINDSLANQPHVTALIAKYEKKLGPKYERAIGTAIQDLSHTRGEESPLGNVVADAMREQAKADMALMNSGGIRRPLGKGKITLRMLHEMFPFGNRLQIVKLTGQELTKVLQHSLKKSGAAFLQVSGVTFRNVKGKPVGIKVNGETLQKKKEYQVVVTDFLVFGGDGYTMLRSAKKIGSSHELLLDAVADHIKKQKNITPPKTDRIK